MCNDPNKVQVDWTKVKPQSQSNGNVQLTDATHADLSRNQTISLITSCNESVNSLISHEHFGYNQSDKKNEDR